MKFPRIAALLHHILTERAHLPSAAVSEQAALDAREYYR